MISVAVAHYKGGTGKSTTCVHVAVAGVCRNLKTVLIDTDIQGSAVEWAHRRAADIPHVVAADAAT